MATLLGSDLPSSDEEDADFTPDRAEVAAQTTVPHKAGKRKEAPGSQITATTQAAAAQSSKRASTAAAWEQLKSAQPHRRTTPPSEYGWASLCAPVSSQRGAASASQDWLAQLGIKQQRQTVSSPSEQKDQTLQLKPASRAAAAAALSSAVLEPSGAAMTSGRFAGKDVQVSQASANESAEQRRQRGLDNVLQSLAVVRDVNTLDKSRSDWSTHKQLNPEEAAELEKYNRSNSKFLDRQDFLNRTTVREYEQERDKRLAGDLRTRGRL